MSKKKNLYNKFLNESRIIKDNFFNKRIQNVIELLKRKNKEESIKLLKYSLKEIYSEENFKKVIEILKSKQYPTSTLESFKFYFKLKKYLKKEYYYILSCLQEWDLLVLFYELNMMLIQDCENIQDIIDFINLIFNYDDKKNSLSKFKAGIYKAKNFNKSKTKQMGDYFSCYGKYKLINQLIMLFEYDFIDFKFINNKNANVINNPSYDLNAIAIAGLDGEISSEWQKVILYLNDEKNLFCLPPDKYLQVIEEELLKVFSLNKFLFSHEQIQGIEIKYWLKAFLLIYKENWNCVQSKENLLCKKSRNEWEAIFIAAGIENRYHSSIFNAFSFMECKCGDRDIVKYPFIEIDNDIYTIPRIVFCSDIVRILISIFEDLENNLQFKGNYYESYIRAKWRENGIKNIQKTDKILKDVFDCDMAFVFDDNLFICEIKNLLQPSSLHEWHKFHIKTQQNLQQLERISNHYSEPQYLKGIVKELLGNEDWVPKKIYSILIYSCYIGSIIENKRAFIASEVDIYNFFARTPLQQYNISRDKKEATLSYKYLDGYEYLEDKNHILNTIDFERYMECPMAIKYQKDRIKIERKKIKVAGIWILLECVEVEEHSIWT
ncbi:hypothetical protein LF65_01567 [Clostridium beijerinckii]|uniref:NERD domain-containing protein n=1 Tax=Clostridium beijerinckii TaxID=1520 RepID=A0A0B5Q7R6_CLOBE|nr:hypothetical protein [Clostridium beijerinckii]AJG98174.1 hypothetical protein LF65_01567 [Clostridium beijerinckii]